MFAGRLLGQAMAARSVPLARLLLNSGARPRVVASSSLARLQKLSPLASAVYTSQRSASTTPHSHAKHFVLERYWAAGMVALFPVAFFIHNPVMDFAIAVALTMHIHWGLYAVVQDYGRPIILGDTLAAVARGAIYVVSVLMFVALLDFNYNDVGITKAFEMVWSL